MSIVKGIFLFIINQQKDVRGCRITDLCTTQLRILHFVFRGWQQMLVQQICKYCVCAGDLCNDNMGSLNWLPKCPILPPLNGMNKTAEQDLALQKECLAFLIHQADWRDQFTFVCPLASPCCFDRGVLHGKPSSSPFCHHGLSGIWNTRIWNEEANAAAKF